MTVIAAETAEGRGGESTGRSACRKLPPGERHPGMLPGCRALESTVLEELTVSDSTIIGGLGASCSGRFLI